MGDQTKAFLYAWCGKSKITPYYDVQTRGPKHSQHFLCECRIDGYDYVGVGKSTRKKDAQTKAARDFLLYLIRRRKLSEEEVPEDILCPEDTPDGILDSQDRPAGYHDRSGKKRRLDEAEDPDANAGIHGNWVLENAKARLHQFFQVNNIIAEYKYSQVGPDHNRSFICEMSFFSKKLGRSFSAREHGLNKQMASRACALSLVRQLYHLQVIEACTEETTRKGGDKLEPHEVIVEANIIEELDAALEAIQVQPMEIPKDLDPKVPFSLQFGMKLTEKKEDSTEMKEEPAETEEAAETEETDNSSEVKIEKSEDKEETDSSLEEKQKKSSTEDDIPSQEETEKSTTDDSKELEKETSNDKESTKLKNNTEQKISSKESSGESQEEIEEKTGVDEETVIEQEEIINWSPPQRNKNPWTNSAIGEGPFTKTLKQISTDLKKEYLRQTKTEAVTKMLEERKKLPIWETRDELLDTIQNNTSVIIRGIAGCGKTTQVPQYILDSYFESGHGAECCIIVTQPRCISAISIAERIAAERCEDIGNSVGYMTRFERCLPRPYGSILFCTAAVLLKRLEFGFRGVSHIIVDEIQERDVNSDFIMMVLRDMMKEYPDIRIILMCGTVDTAIFHEYFSKCPVTDIPTKPHPVQEFFLEDCVQYLNFVPTLPTTTKKKKDNEDDDEESENLNKVIGDDYSESTKSTMTKLSEKEVSFELIEAILTCIETLNIKGTVLVFLPGWNMIASLMKNLQEHSVFSGPSYLILPLHSQMTLEELRRVFLPADEGVTKIVLSTRIAESSITINDVVFVINSCREEIKLFTPPNNLTSYVTMWASKSNLEQRKQCASRNRAGFCFHLCSRARFEKLKESTPPEICRTPLHELALAIRLHHLGYVGSYLGRALTPPHVDAIIQSESMLKEIGALDKDNEITSLGKILACLPVDPRVGKMITAAFLFLLGDPLCIVATHSSAFPEPFDTICPTRLTQVHQYFIGDRWSDHLTILNAFVQWQGAHALSKNAETSFCEQYSLSIPTMRAVNDAKNNLKELLQSLDFPDNCMQEQYYLFNGPDLKLDMVAALLIMGYYPNICYHLDFQKVVTKEDKSALIHHSSVNCTNQPPSFPSPFFVFGEKVHKTPVTCKRLTMVNPVHLLLFGCSKVELINNEILLDEWINLKMDPLLASKILALRPPLESLILEVAGNPELLTEFRPESQQLIDIVKKLCDRDAITHRKYRVELPVQYVEPPPKKQPKVTPEPKNVAPKGTQGRGGPGRGRGGPGRGGPNVDNRSGFIGNNAFSGFRGGPGFGRGMGNFRGFGGGRGFGRGGNFEDRIRIGPHPFGSGFGIDERGPGFGMGGGVFQGLRGGPGFDMGGIESRGDILHRGRPSFGMNDIERRDDILEGLRRGGSRFGIDVDREDRDEILQGFRRGGPSFGIGDGRDDRDDIFQDLRRGGPRDDIFQDLRRGGPAFGIGSSRDDRDDIFQNLRRSSVSIEREDREDILRRLRRGDLSIGSSREDVDDLLRSFREDSLRRRGGFGTGREDRDDSSLRFRREDYDFDRNYEDSTVRSFRRDDSPLGFARRRRDDSPYDIRMDIQERDDSFHRSGGLGRGINRYIEDQGSRNFGSGRGYIGIRGESRDGFRRDFEMETRGRGPFGRNSRRGRPGGRGRDFSDSDSDDSNDRYWGRGIRRRFR